MKEGPAHSAAEESALMSEPGSGNQISNEAVPEVTMGAHTCNPDGNTLC